MREMPHRENVLRSRCKIRQQLQYRGTFVMSKVSQLGYVGIGASNVDAWERFGADKLGLQPHPDGRDADGTLFLREDEYHHRIAVHRSEVEDVLYLGWEVKDEETLAAMKERVGPYLAPKDAT